MSPLNPFFPLIIYFIAFASAYLLRLKFKLNFTSNRFETIDGLRGFLALGVFIHHTSVWHQYLQTGNWDSPKSNVMQHLGQTSVAFFFMITSFLFISKLLNSKENKFNWRNFFISRLFRIIPMYYFTLLIIIIYEMIITNWQLNVPFQEFFLSLVNWFFFTIYDAPFINGQYVVLINAGVQWSLIYEWFFYFSLPLIAVFILKDRPKIVYLIFSIVFVVLFLVMLEVEKYYFYAFIGGGIAPFLMKYTSFSKNINNYFVSVLIVICLVIIIQFDTSKNIICLSLITLVFTSIAMGNSFFTILKNNNLKFLGEICYSTYLLHGLILFSVFQLGFSFDKSKTFSPSTYSIMIFCLTPVVVVVSFFGFKYIEKPFILLSKKIIQKLNERDSTLINK